MAKSKRKGGASRRSAKAPRRSASAPATKKTSKPRSNKSANHRQRPIEPRTKTEACLALLVRPEGASIAELQQVTGWQPHSVRGFLAGTVKKIPGASLTSEKEEGERRYFLRRATT
jgi:hypothetical protein